MEKNVNKGIIPPTVLQILKWIVLLLTAIIDGTTHVSLTKNIDGAHIDKAYDQLTTKI